MSMSFPDLALISILAFRKICYSDQGGEHKFQRCQAKSTLAGAALGADSFSTVNKKEKNTFHLELHNVQS